MDASLTPVTFLFLVFLIIIHPNFFCNGDSQSQIRCIQTERNALLNFKQHLQDPSNRLASWAGDVDCCQWDGRSSATTLLVTSTNSILEASYPVWDEFTLDYDQYEAQSQASRRSMFVGKLNPALLDLKYLNYLDLSYNNFSGTQIPKFLGYRLSVNNLQWLSGLPLLQHLDMSSVNLNEASDWLQVTNKLPSLLELRLSDCGLPFIPPTPSVNFSSLTTLDLSQNSFENTSIPSWIVGLRNLVFLDLSGNSFQGGPTPVLQNMTSLRHLDLSGSDLYVNNLQWLSGLPLLQHLDMSFVYLYEASDWLQVTNKLPSLLELRLSSCGLPFIPPTPSVNFSSLTTLDLSGNRFENTSIPSWIVGLRNLVFLDLSYNGFQGPIPVLQNMTSLRHLDLSGNYFNHSIPNWLYSFSRLEFLSLRQNNLQGTISSAIANLTSAITIDFSLNEFSGKIHGCWTKWQNLRALNLGNNNFTGNIPASMGSLTFLKSLHLHSNKLSCKLPSSLKSCKELVIIDLSENEFVGSVPSWIGHRLLSLVILNLRSNNFHGHIPNELCALTSLQILDLSHNKLSGSIPRCVKNFTAMATKFDSIPNFYFVGSYSSENLPLESTLLVIKGRVNEYSTILHLVKSIDFSKNSLSGEIPKEVTSLQELQSLNLSYNLLIGSIPENIGTMGSLESIDFSVNQLSGQIPSSMSSLTFLNHLNLSNNNLTGKIPLSTQLQSLDASSFSGNKLYGPPLTDNCTVNGVKPNNENIGSKDIGRIEVDWFYVSMVLGFPVGFWGVCGPLLLNKQWRIMYFQFLDHMGYKLKDVLSFQYCECKGLISSQWRKLKLAASKVCGSDSYSRQVRWRLASSRHIEDSAGNKGWNIPMTVFDSEVLTVGLVYLPFASDDICPVIYSI
uniref:Leucine-rich repeat-containing N-terminal plant-type domain-containing protein n=1 Tax=Fagus sylvatica TaxID=28930 RepID=A0A2N9GSZ0_FAGSY